MSQAMRETEENGRLLAMMVEISRFVRHEMRNPLSGILAGLQVLQAEAAPGDDAQDILQLLMNEVRSADAVLDRLVGAITVEISELAACRLQRLVTRVADGTPTATSVAWPSVQVIQGPADAEAIMDEGAMCQALLNLAIYCLKSCETPETLRMGWRYVPEDEAETLFPGFTGRIVNVFMEVAAGHVKDHLTDTSFLRLVRESESKWAVLRAAQARQTVDIHGGFVRLGKLPQEGAAVHVFLPGELPLSRGAVPGCPCADQAGEARAGAKDTSKPPGTSGLCWFSVGLTRRLQMGEWPEMCLKCPVFRAHNLSLYAG